MRLGDNQTRRQKNFELSTRADGAPLVFDDNSSNDGTHSANCAKVWLGAALISAEGTSGKVVALVIGNLYSFVWGYTFSCITWGNTGDSTDHYQSNQHPQKTANKTT